MKYPTYPSYSDKCGWNALLPPRQPKASANGAISAKYAVVGAGFTGLAVARRLSELDPTSEIVILEATTIGEGSSGRNSGFLAAADIAGSTDAKAVEQNIARNRYVKEGFDWLLALIERHAIARNMSFRTCRSSARPRNVQPTLTSSCPKTLTA